MELIKEVERIPKKRKNFMGVKYSHSHAKEKKINTITEINDIEIIRDESQNFDYAKTKDALTAYGHAKKELNEVDRKEAKSAINNFYGDYLRPFERSGPAVIIESLNEVLLGLQKLKSTEVISLSMTSENEIRRNVQLTLEFSLVKHMRRNAFTAKYVTKILKVMDSVGLPSLVNTSISDMLQEYQTIGGRNVITSEYPFVAKIFDFWRSGMVLYSSYSQTVREFNNQDFSGFSKDVFKYTYITFKKNVENVIQKIKSELYKTVTDELGTNNSPGNLIKVAGLCGSISIELLRLFQSGDPRFINSYVTNDIPNATIDMEDYVPAVDPVKPVPKVESKTTSYAKLFGTENRYER